MRSKTLSTDTKTGERTLMLVAEVGDEAFNAITTFARENNINAASVTGIGAFESASLAFFDVGTKEYRNIPVEGQTEVLSLVGDITLDEDGTPLPHLHAVLGFSDGHTRQTEVRTHASQK